MKKVLFCLLAVIALTACEEKEPVYIYEDSGTWKNIRLKVNSGDWVLDGVSNELESYYYYDFKVNELTSDIFKEGVVLMYIESEPGNPNIKSLMPFTYHRGINVNGVESLWEEYYTYDFEPGFVRIYCKYSDFFTGEQRPGTEVFHMVLIN